MTQNIQLVLIARKNRKIFNFLKISWFFSQYFNIFVGSTYKVKIWKLPKFLILFKNQFKKRQKKKTLRDFTNIFPRAENQIEPLSLHDKRRFSCSTVFLLYILFTSSLLCFAHRSLLRCRPCDYLPKSVTWLLSSSVVD